jgi:integrase
VLRVPKIAKELSDKEAARLAKLPHGKPYAVLYAVGGCRGLQLKVSPTATASWLLRFKLQNGRRIDRSLGVYPEVSLKEARQLGNELRKKLWESPRIDPTLERKRVAEQARAEQEAAGRAAKVTFGQDAEALHSKLAQEFRNAKHSAQWLSSLREHAKPLWDKPVSEVTRDDVLAVLLPIWNTKTETATRVRQRVEQVLAFSAVKGHRPDNAANPAQWIGGLQLLLPKPTKLKKVKHHAALPYADMAWLMGKLRAKGTQSARALEFAILTAARSGEVRLATWSEIDLKAKLWTVPAERMKARKEHRVPLSSAAIALLKSLDKREGCELLFPNGDGKPLSDMTLSKLLKDMNIAAVPHGFRSTFKTYCQEALGARYTDEASELSLAHVNDDKTRAAYARGELLEERRKLMQEWAEFLRGSDHG